VGNIYASEALFNRGFASDTGVHRLRSADWLSLVVAIQRFCAQPLSVVVQLCAIHPVERRAGRVQKSCSSMTARKKPCRKCDADHRSKVMAGRSTYWCDQCQSELGC